MRTKELLDDGAETPHISTVQDRESSRMIGFVRYASAALLGLGAAGCIGPGLEPPGGNDSARTTARAGDDRGPAAASTETANPPANAPAQNPAPTTTQPPAITPATGGSGAPPAMAAPAGAAGGAAPGAMAGAAGRSGDAATREDDAGVE